MTENERSERWKPIQNYEGKYEVSDQGRVRSLNFRSHRELVVVLKSRPNPAGYQMINLSRFGNKITSSIHTLVLEAFVGPRPRGLVCDHIDANKNNNHVGNLRWISNRENVVRGNIQRGSKNPRAKLNEAQVIRLRKRYAQGGVTYRKLAEEFGVCFQVVSEIILRHIWKHV